MLSSYPSSSLVLIILVPPPPPQPPPTPPPILVVLKSGRTPNGRTTIIPVFAGRTDGTGAGGRAGTGGNGKKYHHHKRGTRYGCGRENEVVSGWSWFLSMFDLACFFYQNRLCEVVITENRRSKNKNAPECICVLIQIKFRNNRSFPGGWYKGKWLLVCFGGKELVS